jgi:hypothetical protein
MYFYYKKINQYLSEHNSNLVVFGQILIYFFVLFVLYFKMKCTFVLLQGGQNNGLLVKV